MSVIIAIDRRVAELERLAVEQQSSMEALLKVAKLQQDCIRSLIDAMALNTASIKTLAKLDGIELP